MNKKIKPIGNGFVFSTNPDFKLQDDEAVQESLAPNKQKLRVQLETKHRGGKAATIVFGFIGNESDLETLGKKLKTFCGTGGTTKNGEIIIQGDQREKIIQWLLKNDYTNSKKAGG